MPAQQTQLNMTALKMSAISACPRGILATIYHSLIARVLTIKFHVDFAINLNMTQAKQHEYWRLGKENQRATKRNEATNQKK